MLDLTERNANLILLDCHMPISCRSVDDRRESLGSCKPKILFFIKYDNSVCSCVIRCKNNNFYIPLLLNLIPLAEFIMVVTKFIKICNQFHILTGITADVSRNSLRVLRCCFTRNIFMLAARFNLKDGYISQNISSVERNFSFYLFWINFVWVNRLTRPTYQQQIFP